MRKIAKWLILINGILAIVCGLLMILYGFDVIQLAKPVRIGMAAVMCLNALVNLANYRRVSKQMKK